MADLSPGYSYKIMSRAELLPHIRTHHNAVFTENGHLEPLYALSKTEQTALDTLGKRLSGRYRLGFGLFQGDTFIGWHMGQQVIAGQFEMSSTGILAEHRRRGLYSAIIPIVLETVRKEGFQVVYSRHNLTNNAVIIPKLKA